MIKVNEASKYFDQLCAVNKVSVTIEKGHIHGLLGPNGAGKTTLIRSIVGLYDLDDGEITIDDEILTRDHYALKRRIGVVSQHINLDKELTLEENLEFAGRLYQLEKSTIKKRVHELLEAFDLEKSKDRQAKHASGGMKRKLMIAKALIHEPDLIILDEPTVGIDVKARKEIWEMLLKLRGMGKTMLLTTHYIEEAEYLSDMISLMNHGEILYTDKIKNLIDKLGMYCFEYQENHRIKRAYFSQEMDAQQHKSTGNLQGVIRMTQLEDVYTTLIEAKVNSIGD